MSRCYCFFFIDAAGDAVIEGQDHFTDMAPYRRNLRSVFGYSSACVPSILSGAFPEEHLHWNFFTHRGPDNGLKVPGWVSMLPPFLRDRGRVRAKISPSVAKLNNIEGYFQMYMMPVGALSHYSHCEPRDIFRPGGLNRGTTIFDLLVKERVPSWWPDWHKPEDENWGIMKQMAADPSKRFLFMYAASLDGWLHDNTRQSPLLGRQLADIRNRIDGVLDVARQHHDEVQFAVFSDHGMCTINEHLDLFPVLEQSGLKMHVDYHCVIDSTMIRIWYNDDAQRERFRNLLDAVPQLTWCSPDFLAKERCAFEDNRFGDDIWLAAPHVLLVPSHMGKVPLAGMHGYSCDHEDSNASFLSNIPDAKPDTIVDIYKVMEQAALSVAKAKV